ncbi:1-acyl-sn-glycerol-3-phosphate acyltransferase [Vogesella sp. LIG4]|uniref:lysophospholipid acyltransferase family protein n=1 Tax=Vogesella sp. LIG4 TaxID=1192162 RepID=UPI00081FB046|nr:lysophospholipid acyltransferase family protein [Vogesella sp. LIG4]SCK09647.1 1-acyl-sn-glycerol-3-phosphate acyltransferase [Vogesella sp. LIG4]
MHQTTSLLVRLLRIARLAAHVFRGVITIATLYPRLSQPEKAVITQRWSQQLLHILAIKVKVTGQAPGVYPPHTLVVANHVSWLDIFALNSVTVSRFVAKKELRDWPLAGFLIKSAGTLFIDRSKRRDTSQVNKQLAAALHNGDCMAVFPEATTSDGTGLLPFKSSLFEAARLAGATVQPVAIRYVSPGGHYCASAAYAGDTSFGQSLWAVLSTRAMVVELSFTAAMPAADASRFALSESSRSAIAAALDLPADA